MREKWENEWEMSKVLFCQWWILSPFLHGVTGSCVVGLCVVCLVIWHLPGLCRKPYHIHNNACPRILNGSVLISPSETSVLFSVLELIFYWPEFWFPRVLGPLLFCTGRRSTLTGCRVYIKSLIEKVFAPSLHKHLTHLESKGAFSGRVGPWVRQTCFWSPSIQITWAKNVNVFVGCKCQ